MIMTAPEAVSSNARAMIGRYAPPLLVAACLVLWIAQLFLDNGGVGFVTGIVVWLIAWWTILFAVLPYRTVGQFETGDVVPGSEPGAPAEPMLRRKAWMTTVITSAFWLVFFVIVEFRLIGLEAIPFLPTYEPVT